jgi:hypothetical protein
MTTPDALVARFSDPAGFKKYIGFLGGKLAKAAHQAYATADQRGAAESYLLDTREHDGTYYHLRAIGTRGNLDETTLAQLAQDVKLVPLNRVRYEGMLSPTIPDAVGSNPEAGDVHALSRLDQGIIVYAVTQLSKKAASTWALWAVKGGQFYVYPLEDKKL